MKEIDIQNWLDVILPKHKKLKKITKENIKNLLKKNNIDALLVSGRTKTEEKIRNKINKKRYSDPDKEMTDITGIRVIVYFESDVEKVSNLIETSFVVDSENSLGKF